jgi:hypothetical protein
MRVFYQQELGQVALYEEGEKDWTRPLCTTERREDAEKIKAAINEPAGELSKAAQRIEELETVVKVLSSPNEWWPCERYDDFKTYFGCDNQCAPCRVKWATEWAKGWRPDSWTGK